MRTLSTSISNVIEHLDRSPLTSQCVVFGSLLSAPSEAQDVDIAIMIEAPFSNQALDAFRPLLRAGAYGTPRYGLLDVFVCFSDCTWVRDGDCRGFTVAKNARALRANIKKSGQPWHEWRRSVQTAHEAAQKQDDTIYFAHPISTYCEPVEDHALSMLAGAGRTVVNPSDHAHQDACGSDMNKWAELASSCDAIAFLPFEDGAIGAGVMKEVDTVHAQGKRVFKIEVDGSGMTEVHNWPQGERLLSVDETRARINPFRDARREAGLAPIPTRQSSASSARKLRP